MMKNGCLGDEIVGFDEERGATGTRGAGNDEERVQR